jgi:TM2 domain-containing membrane protein YozV
MEILRHSTNVEIPNMAVTHKNKTLDTFLAAAFGSLGVHRFYLHGWRDIWAWLHLASAPISVFAILVGSGQPVLFLGSLFLVSALTAFVEALVIGLVPDDKWDAAYNRHSGRKSESGWPLALLLVLTMGIGAIALIATIARTFDLLFTGGAYG